MQARGAVATATKVDAVFATMVQEFSAIGVEFNLKTEVY
jgi:hypothetical protein